MLVQINTDSNINGREEMEVYYTSKLESSLNRFDQQITRLEVHLGDENSHKHSADDKRCMIEARLKGMQPIAVTHHSDTLELAVNGAIDKLKRALESAIGKLRSY